MKKFLLLLPALALTGFISCKKCQTCTTTTVQSYNGFSQTTNSSNEYCGDEYDDAPAESHVEQPNQTVTVSCEDN